LSRTLRQVHGGGASNRADGGVGAHIFTMNADGSDIVQLTSTGTFNGDAAWSPDGQRIIFRSDRDGDPQLYIMNADGSNPTRITHSPGWDFHPEWVNRPFRP
jgi:Tol biopolymer transport system component